MNIINKKYHKYFKPFYYLLWIICIYLFLCLVFFIMNSLHDYTYIKPDGHINVEYNVWLDSSFANLNNVSIVSGSYEIINIFKHKNFNYVAENMEVLRIFSFSKWSIYLNDGRRRMIPYWSPLHKRTEQLTDTIKAIKQSKENNISIIF